MYLFDCVVVVVVVVIAVLVDHFCSIKIIGGFKSRGTGVLIVERGFIK